MPYLASISDLEETGSSIEHCGLRQREIACGVLEALPMGASAMVVVVL